MTGEREFRRKGREEVLKGRMGARSKRERERERESFGLIEINGDKIIS